MTSPTGPGRGAPRSPSWTSSPASGWARLPRPQESPTPARARRASIAILDVVSRKWLATLTSAEESSTQVEACFLAALDAEDLLEAADELATAALREAITSGARDAVHDLAGDGQGPVLPALRDNGPPLHSCT